MENFSSAAIKNPVWTGPYWDRRLCGQQLIGEPFPLKASLWHQCHILPKNHTRKTVSRLTPVGGCIDTGERRNRAMGDTYARVLVPYTEIEERVARRDKLHYHDLWIRNERIVREE